MKIIEPVHNINLKERGSFNDFKPGLSPEGFKSLNFLEEDTIYVFIDSVGNFHHFILTILVPAIEVISSEDNKKLHFVLYSGHQKKASDNFDNLLTEMLVEKRINYTSINSNVYEYVNAKNFIPVNGGSLDDGFPKLYDYFIEKYNIVPSTPSKKLYISRNKYKTEEKRIDNEEILEKLFEENGFQIVYPEEIKTFQEQIELFSSCSILAGLTGTGLTNLLFMPKNQIVIEIVTRLEIGVTDSHTGRFFTEEQIHNHYKEFCIKKDHMMINVFNMQKSAEDIEKKVRLALESLKLLSV